MKQKEQMGQLLVWLSEWESCSYQKVLDYCVNRGIVTDKDELNKVLKKMEAKGLLTLSVDMITVHLTTEEARKLCLAGFSQSYINGGSSKKMVYTPPSTNLP